MLAGSDDTMRHDGKRDLPEPYKSVAWSFGHLAAVARGAAEAMRRFTEAWTSEVPDADRRAEGTDPLER